VVHPETGSLAALGAGFIALTHECRAALQHANAAVEMLERRLDGQPELLGLTAEIHTVLDQLGRLHDDARSFTAPVELALASCDLRRPLLDAWTDLARVRDGRDASLALVSDEAEPVCEADAFALRVVFRNLYANSLAVCSDPVRLDVRIAAAPPDALEITVRDNGPGIAADLQPRVFEPFVTRRAGGTGLGLAIARKLIRAHGGEIAVSSSPGPGAAFVITLHRA
jgi:signal transduction histidine kinase